MSHETYLESFIDQITTTPHELRRNLELIKDLDKSCTTIIEQLRTAEQEYVSKAEDKVLQLELLPMNNNNNNNSRNSNNNKQKKQLNSSSSGGGGSKKKAASKNKKKKNNNNKNDEDDDNNNMNITPDGGSDENKDEEKKMPAYGIKVLGNNPSPVAKEEEQQEEEKSTTTPVKQEAPSSTTKSSSKKRKTRGGASPAPPQQQSSTTTTASKKQQQQQPQGPLAIIPTTEELSAYVHLDKDDEYQNILSLRSKATQQADEKVAIAEQAYSLVDTTVKRLDSDLAKLETLLKNSGEFIPSMTATTTTLAGSASTEGIGGGMMMANTISSSTGGGIHNLNHRHSEIDQIVGVTTSSMLGGDGSSSSRGGGGGEAILFSRSGSVVGRGSGGTGGSGLGSGGHGGPIIPGLGRPNELVAVQTNPTTSPHEWILGKIISYNKDTGMYKIADEDIESNHKVFTLPYKNVVILGSNPPRGNQRIDKIGKGDVIFAVYPDTTSFYQATIVQAPRKLQGSDSNDHSIDSSFVLVNFIDDGDEHGITHDKAVLLKHCMRVPQDVPLQ